MLEVKNQNGEAVMKLTEDGKVHVLSEELYIEGKVKKDDEPTKKDDEDKNEG